MYHKSPYPDVPALPEANAHYLFFKRPDQAEWGNHTVHIDPVTGLKRKYRDFVARVQDAATALGAPVDKGGLGLCAEDGEIIGIMSENCSDYIALVHACIFIATPFALLSSYSTPFEFKHALTLSKATRLFIQPSLLAVVLPVAKEVGFPLDNIYILNGPPKARRSFSGMVDEVRHKKLSPVSVRPAKNDTLAYLVFSSGTSGLPKAVMISHGNLSYSLAQMIVLQRCTAEVYTPPKPRGDEGIPVSLAFLPLHHSYGLHAYCFRALLAPCTLVILAKWDVDLAFKAIPKYKVSNLGVIPSVVHQIVNHPKVHRIDFSSVITMGSGAAYLPVELQKKMEALIPKEVSFAQGYGMSEATIAALTQPFPGVLGGRLQRIPGCLGVLLPGMEARIIREDGTEAGVDEVGELLLRSPNIALGYWNNEKANRDTFVDGWLRTGDQFRVDRHGNFYFADRSKDTLKISGAQVSPVEIEDLLLSHPKKLISDVSVAGVSGGRTSDEKVPRAWVVLTNTGKKLGAAAVIKELETWHQENLSKYKWLRGGIEIVKEIPKSPTGKTLRRLLQESYEQKIAKSRL